MAGSKDPAEKNNKGSHVLMETASALQAFQATPALFRMEDAISFISGINKNANSSAAFRMPDGIPPRELAGGFSHVHTSVMFTLQQLTQAPPIVVVNFPE